ncbi:hypothetical protein [Hymenobacter sp.]|uniref:hypothetical protein n=1 Tax=Hymenobacter sp. TaxID=1898978 RepID=UPI00286D0F68|nr:hypothetical protein [Hymenobacter sp.]
MNKPLIALGVVLLGLTSCGQKPAEETTTAPAATTAPAPAAPVASAPPETGVARAEVAPPPPAAALDTQPGPRGTQVALTKALVRGDILTVELQYSVSPNADSEPIVHEPLSQVNYIDDATSRKYGVLKDQEGAYMASPMRSDNKELRVLTSKTGPAIVTVKFPAPPPTSQTISLTIPNAGSFNGVAVQR